MQRAYSETDGDRDTANTDFKRQKTDDGDDDGFGKPLFKDDCKLNIHIFNNSNAYF